jgi:uncharacterized membrane protein
MLKMSINWIRVMGCVLTIINGAFVVINGLESNWISMAVSCVAVLFSIHMIWNSYRIDDMKKLSKTLDVAHHIWLRALPDDVRKKLNI